jgi:D-glycero-alpha-D-manno-heptose-7-phosphate kinase
MGRTVTATAPVRICDLGGWTDTWFAGRGLVLNIAVRPGATARVTHHPRGSRPDRVTIEAPDLPDGPDDLLWAVVDHVGVPADGDLEVVVSCGVPPGAAMGTSAAVTVALLAALHAGADRPTGDGEAAPPALADLADPPHLADPPGVADPPALAAEAHAVEVEQLGREGGVQDQVAAAYGGVNRIEIGPYPATRVTPITAPADLDRQLRTVYLGAPHVSSAMHQRVIDVIAAEGPSSPRLERLRRAAAAGCDALVAGDLAAFGRAMIDNTDAQSDLASGIVGDDAAAVIAVARAAGALGWKVNGAGGPGGTVTVLLDPARPAGAFEDAVTAAGYALLRVALTDRGATCSSSR